jgi:formate-dependent nitrite reductase membrane component NrfD
MVAGYTAFLFGQAEGRDLWQSPALFWHLLAQAVMTGAGALLIVVPFVSPETSVSRWLGWALIAGVVAHLLIVAVEFGGRHQTQNATVAAHSITHGRYARTFWFGSIGLAIIGAVFVIPVLMGGSLLFGLIAGLLVQVALLAHETVFVKAAQDVPLS